MCIFLFFCYFLSSACVERGRCFQMKIRDSVPFNRRPIFLRCVHTSNTATTIEKRTNDTDVSPYLR